MHRQWTVWCGGKVRFVPCPTAQKRQKNCAIQPRDMSITKCEVLVVRHLHTLSSMCRCHRVFSVHQHTRSIGQHGFRLHSQRISDCTHPRLPFQLWQTMRTWSSWRRGKGKGAYRPPSLSQTHPWFETWRRTGHCHCDWFHPAVNLHLEGEQEESGGG